jgi:hypothetical protein
MAVPTEMEALPGYLRSVTILKPAGDLVADTVSQTARIAAWRAHRRMLAITAALAVVLIVAGVVWRFKYSADAAPKRITLLKSLSLFHEPDQSSEIVAQLKPGDEFTLTKAPFNPNWVAVEANGAKAWAMTQDLVYQQIGGPGTIALGAGLGYEGSYWKLFFTTPRGRPAAQQIRDRRALCRCYRPHHQVAGYRGVRIQQSHGGERHGGGAASRC